MNLLLDINIFINYLRGMDWEKNLLRHGGIAFYYSRVTRKELFLYKNMSESERKKIHYLLGCFREVKITKPIAKKASFLLEKYKKHFPTVPDMLIAGTAWDKNMTLVTKNTKDFSFIKEIHLYPVS